jgi:hypothetical protein
MNILYSIRNSYPPFSGPFARPVAMCRFLSLDSTPGAGN